MSKSKHLVGLILAATLMATLIPFSAMVYAQNSEGKRAEKFVELAERAGEKVGNFIDFIHANEDAMAAITTAGLAEELGDNEELFETGMGCLDDARDALVAGEFSDAIASATEALSIFREVFKALNTILAEAEVERGELIDAQGLIEAMKRALDRIERIEDMEPPEDVLEILDSAKEYLDIETAIEWLSEGRVNEVAQNLAQANRLISQAFVSLKKAAGALNVKRIQSYLKVIEKHYDRTWRLAEKAGAGELITRLEEEVQPSIDEATDHFEDEEYSEAIASLVEARNLLKGIERDLVEFRRGGP